VTSGQFHSIDVNSILVTRDDRQRTELTEIPVLADSISRLGLIHPLVVTRDFVLVAGERRLAAIKSLGWTAVSIQYVDELDQKTLKAIELEENIKRKDISWRDQVSAIHEYHNLQKSEDPSWYQENTAVALGLSHNFISEVLYVGNELAKGNERVVEAPMLSTAIGIVRRAREREDNQVLEKVKETVLGPQPKKEEIPETIITADFTEWCQTHTAPRFNLIHCDFPYGIDADTFNQGSAPSHGGYADTPETWERLMEGLAFTTQNLTTSQCHLMFWFAMRKGSKRLYEMTCTRLERMGWDINPLPLIWMKSDGAGIIPDPERGPRQIYETCLFGSRGDRKIVRAVANAYSAPTVRDKHMSEKPEPVLRHFFGMLVDENTVMLDPTCGSGSAVRAAEAAGAKFCLGVEINSEFAEIAREALKRARNLRKASETSVR